MKNPPKPKPNACAYCHGYGIDKGHLPYRRPHLEKRPEKETIPCDRCGKMGVKGHEFIKNQSK